MEIKRFFGKRNGSNFILEEDEYYHCVKVSRYKVGYDIIIFIGNGIDYYCKIIDINQTNVIAELISEKANDFETRGKIVLAQALCKEFDFIVQKAIELGVSEIIPFTSSRTNVKEIKKPRVEKIILEAVKQCGRAVIPYLSETLKFDELLLKYPLYKNRMFCFEQSKEKLLSSQISWVDRDVLVVIGSEGGFSNDEVIDARKAGFKECSLGKRILKAETAAITSLILIMNKYEEI